VAFHPHRLSGYQKALKMLMGGVRAYAGTTAGAASGGWCPARSHIRARHRVDVLKRHEGDREVGAAIVQWQRGGVGDPDVHRWIERAGRVRQGGRGIDADDPMPEPLQMPRQASFAAADVDRLAAGRRQQPKELIAMVSPVTVVSGLLRPLNPPAGFGFPAVSEIHGILPICPAPVQCPQIPAACDPSSHAAIARQQ
jgi:hypothetical protein